MQLQRPTSIKQGLYVHKVTDLDVSRVCQSVGVICVHALVVIFCSRNNIAINRTGHLVRGGIGQYHDL